MKKYLGRIVEKGAKISGGIVSKNTKSALLTIPDGLNLFDDVEKIYTEQENGTGRAQIPRKPLDPAISWIVTQSLLFQIADPFCVFASTQIYKGPIL